MKFAGVWVAVFGYTLIYVGLNTLADNKISFVDALTGKTPTTQNSASATQQAGNSFIDNAANLLIPGGGLLTGALGVSYKPPAASPSTGAATLVQV